MYAFQTSRFHSQEPRWLDCKKFPRSALPAEDARWLLDTGSLTAHLRRVSGGNFHVEVLYQRWQIPRLSERRLLGMGDRDWGLVREVRLHCRNQPWVYARSVLPATSLVGRLDRLRTLDNRPLGHLLFTDPHMSRDRYEICRVSADAVGIGLAAEMGEEVGAAIATKKDNDLWGRRSRFLLSGHPIMVSEIFLPAFRPW